MKLELNQSCLVLRIAKGNFNLRKYFTYEKFCILRKRQELSSWHVGRSIEHWIFYISWRIIQVKERIVILQHIACCTQVIKGESNSLVRLKAYSNWIFQCQCYGKLVMLIKIIKQNEMVQEKLQTWEWIRKNNSYKSH